MKILIPIKRVIDFNVKIRVKPDRSGVESKNVKMSINPFDEIAVEEALRLKEKGLAQELVVVSIGPDEAQEVLRHALAMGADRAILIKNENNLETLNRAKLLKVLVDKENPQLVLLGKQAIDDDCNQTGQMLAALLNWPQGTFVSQLEIQNNQIKITREVDEGLETLELSLPAVITTDLRLNVPRYISLPNIIKAKQKKLDVINSTDLVPTFKKHLEILSVEAPPTRQAGVKLESIEVLLTTLKNEAKVL